jgi:hypothetical protein
MGMEAENMWMSFRYISPLKETVCSTGLFELLIKEKAGSSPAFKKMKKLFD